MVALVLADVLALRGDRLVITSVFKLLGGDVSREFFAALSGVDL